MVKFLVFAVNKAAELAVQDDDPSHLDQHECQQHETACLTCSTFGQAPAQNISGSIGTAFLSQ
jgi:hypothetical protein